MQGQDAPRSARRIPRSGTGNGDAQRGPGKDARRNLEIRTTGAQHARLRRRATRRGGIRSDAPGEAGASRLPGLHIRAGGSAPARTFKAGQEGQAGQERLTRPSKRTQRISKEQGENVSRIRRHRVKALAVAAAAVAVMAALAASAMGVTVKSGNIVVNFDGSISPSAFPKKEKDPLNLQLKGSLETL